MLCGENVLHWCFIIDFTLHGATAFFVVCWLSKYELHLQRNFYGKHENQVQRSFKTTNSQHEIQVDISLQM